MPSIRHNGAALYYETHGPADGPAVVLSHGMGGNAASWWQQVPSLAQGYRVLVFDHRGFARSTCDTPADFDRGRFVGDLCAILDHAGIGRAAQIGQSMGGLTTLGFALAHPDRTAALILCATTGGIHDETIAQRLATMRPPGTPLSEIVGAALAPNYARQNPAMAFLYDQIHALNTAIDYTKPTELNAPGLRVSAAQLKDFRIPTLVLAGVHDRLVPPDVMRRVASLIPDADFRLLSGVGHSSYFEDPETFNAVVSVFLARHGGHDQLAGAGQVSARASAGGTRSIRS